MGKPAIVRHRSVANPPTPQARRQSGLFFAPIHARTAKARLQVAPSGDTMPSMAAIATIHRNSIIDQLAQGKRLSDIIPALGLASPNAISKVLKSDPDYREAIESGLSVRLDQAEKAIEDSAEQVDVARARARFQSVAWRAERECPAVWGQRSTVQVEPVLMVHVVRVGPQVIPGEPQRGDSATPQLPDSVK